MRPFSYPASPHRRRHGPSGYATIESYRPWLRDEFSFRCAYCLKREQWGILRGTYHLDHFVPQSHSPEEALDYDNLLYACATCNIGKGDATIPDPCDCMVEGEVIVREDGHIEGSTPNARRLIRILGLDDAEWCEFRRLWIDIASLAEHHDHELLFRLMKYPVPLPDLSTLVPPTNARPDGVDESCHARQLRGELPKVY